MEINGMPKFTNARIIIIRELSSGPKKWGQLQKAYYGEGRAALKVNTSFWNQKQKCIELGIMQKNTAIGGYELGPVGHQMLDFIRANNIDMNVKSEAQVAYEAKNSQL